MCLAIPGKITKIEGHKVLVEYPGQTRQALVGNEPVKVGDYVLVQMGIVIKILTPSEAKEAQLAWK
ncbi:MAG: hypothetical protein A2857_00710 [Candidatus Levybacteria bacterium RIFCSPHIGHO2_01_FULL_36_15]|nr:MAG: hypothetical protein A2857_00710 [Candidatus Levybacteria bacterium RIFCSPHIGHO2_01_FULL_36_15]OGH37211.1 MAG: hypothetical protein A2905_04530 [Candidatus Levybacteria bacterium RIFCSPLOWO2_01_FULL_36_10]